MDNNTYNTGVYLAENNDQNIYEMHNYFMQKYFSHTLPKKEFSTYLSGRKYPILTAKVAAIKTTYKSLNLFSK